MTKRLQFLAIAALAAFLAGCQGPCDSIESINRPTLTAGDADFSTYVSVGTSISAGTQSNGLVDRHQVRSFPAIFARQIGKTVLSSGTGDFTLPVVDFDGFPALLRVASYSPLILTNAGRTTGNFINNAHPSSYRNMAVPFAIALDFVDSTHYYATVPPVNRTPLAQNFFTNIVRHRGTIAQQALGQGPTFMTFEYGSNEVLGPTTLGTTINALTSNAFAAATTAGIDAIHATLPNTKVAVVNVPDPTLTPYVRTFSAFTVSLTTGQPVALIGPGSTALSAGDFVLLSAGPYLAQGIGIPVGAYNYVNPAAPGTGQSLPDSTILSVAEASAALTEVAEMNAHLDSLTQRPFVAKVDFNGLLNTVAVNGYRLGATTYTLDFITGGLFSLDGVHPNDLAHAALANLLIDAVNAKFGSGVPRVNPSDYASTSASKAGPASPASGLPQPITIDAQPSFLSGYGSGFDR